MREWVVIALGLASLVGLGFLARGCGGGGRGGEEPVALTAAERAGVEAAARAAAEAASKGDTAALDAAITPGLPPRELQAVRAGLAALKGKAPMAVKEAEGLSSGGARVTLEGQGLTRTWRFDRGPDGTWTLSGA